MLKYQFYAEKQNNLDKKSLKYDLFISNCIKVQLKKNEPGTELIAIEV